MMTDDAGSAFLREIEADPEMEPARVLGKVVNAVLQMILFAEDRESDLAAAIEEQFGPEVVDQYLATAMAVCGECGALVLKARLLLGAGAATPAAPPQALQ